MGSYSWCVATWELVVFWKKARNRELLSMVMSNNSGVIWLWPRFRASLPASSRSLAVINSMIAASKVGVEELRYRAYWLSLRRDSILLTEKDRP